MRMMVSRFLRPASKEALGDFYEGVVDLLDELVCLYLKANYKLKNLS